MLNDLTCQFRRLHTFVSLGFKNWISIRYWAIIRWVLILLLFLLVLYNADGDLENLVPSKPQGKSSGTVLPFVGVACLGAILFGYHLGYGLI